MLHPSEDSKNLSTEPKFGLKREVGLVTAVNCMLSYVIGSGLFVTPGTVLAESGSVGMMLIVWIVCGVISCLSCLPFGELSSVVPRSGSIYIYLYTAFNHRHPFFGGIPAFTYFWMMYLILLPCATAVSSILFADYVFATVQDFMENETISDLALKKTLVGAACLILTGIVNCISVKIYVTSQNILAYTKMVAIVVLVGCGLYLCLTGKALKFDPGFKGTNLSVENINQALYFGLYTYDGGCCITNITEEIKYPEKNILRSILIGLTITSFTYVLTNVTFLTALTPEEIASGTTVISQFATKVFGVAGSTVATVIVCLSLLSSIMVSVFYASRLGYVAAREGHLPGILCCIQKKTETPAPAITAQVLLSLIYFFVGGNISVLINMYVFFVWISYGIAMLTVFVLRRQLPEANRPFKVWTAVPVSVIIISAWFFVVSLMSGKLSFIVSFIICLTLSTIVFYFFLFRKLRSKKLDEAMNKLQIFLGLVHVADEPTF